jgi:hypothetical protein
MLPLKVTVATGLLPKPIGEASQSADLDGAAPLEVPKLIGVWSAGGPLSEKTSTRSYQANSLAS